jgi:hypothetical protein
MSFEKPVLSSDVDGGYTPIGVETETKPPEEIASSSKRPMYSSALAMTPPIAHVSPHLFFILHPSTFILSNNLPASSYATLYV